VFDADYDLARLAFLLADLPGRVLGRFRSDRVFRLPLTHNSTLTEARQLPTATALSGSFGAASSNGEVPRPVRQPGVSRRSPVVRVVA
jgi:hypothetical protein